MGLVSLTAVGAFDAVGSILVVALMIAPAATAYLLTDSLPRLLLLAAGIGAVSAVAGYWLAYALGRLDWLDGDDDRRRFPGRLAPRTGPRPRRRRPPALPPAARVRAVARSHLANHEGRPESVEESRIDHLDRHLRWEPDFAVRIVRLAERRGLVRARGPQLVLTQAGRELAADAVAR